MIGSKKVTSWTSRVFLTDNVCFGCIAESFYRKIILIECVKEVSLARDYKVKFHLYFKSAYMLNSEN